MALLLAAVLFVLSFLAGRRDAYSSFSQHSNLVRT